MKSLSRERLALSPGRWRIVRKCKPHPAPGVPQVYRCGAYCCTAVVDWSARAAPRLLYCCGGRLVGGWVVGAWWVAARSRSTRWRGVVKRQTSRVSYRAAGSQDSETKCSSRTGVPSDILLHCRTAVVAWSAGGRGARGWIERVV